MRRPWILPPLLALLPAGSGCDEDVEHLPQPYEPCSRQSYDDGIADGEQLPLQKNSTDSPFRSLEVHPTDPNTVWIGTEGNGILKSLDGGQTWARYRRGLRSMDSDGYAEVYNI